MIKIKRNVKKGERRKLEIKRSSKSKERALAVKFRSKSEPLRKSPPSRQNGFAASKHPLQKFSQLRRGPLAHECHFASPYTRFVAAKWLRSLHALKSSISQPMSHFEGCFATAKPPFGTRVPLRSTCTPISQLQNGLRLLQSGTRVPKGGFVAAKHPSKWLLGCEIPAQLCAFVFKRS